MNNYEVAYLLSNALLEYKPTHTPSPQRARILVALSQSCRVWYESIIRTDAVEQELLRMRFEARPFMPPPSIIANAFYVDAVLAARLYRQVNRMRETGHSRIRGQCADMLRESGGWLNRARRQRQWRLRWKMAQQQL